MDPDTTQFSGAAEALPESKPNVEQPEAMSLDNENSTANTPSAPEADGLDEEAALKNLTENVRDQDDLERDITLQASRVLIEAEDKRDQKRIEKAEATRVRLENQKKTQQQKLRPGITNPTARLRIQQEVARIDAEIELCDKDIADFRARIEQRNQQGETDTLAPATGKRLPNETQREYLIRTGKITPFAKFGGPRPAEVEGDLANAIVDAEDEAVAEELEEKEDDGPRSHQNLRLPGFAEESEVATVAAADEFSLRPRKRRRVQPRPESEDEFVPGESGSEAASPEADVSDDYDDYDMTDTTPKKRKKAVREADGDDKVDLSGIDDGNENVYQARLKDWVARRSNARRARQQRLGQPVDRDDGVEEWFKPSSDQPDHQFENGLKLPGDIYPSLFDYQKTGVQWLAELYAQQVGGIVGDEMGLGKTGMLSPMCS